MKTILKNVIGSVIDFAIFLKMGVPDDLFKTQ